MTAMDESSHALPPVRSLLFAPADRPDRFAKAMASGADALVLDLEDGVAPTAKTKAREATIAFLSEVTENTIWAVRLNHVSTEAGLHDLLALRAAGRKPPFVMLPKAETIAEIDIALSHLTSGNRSPGIIALIESACGLGAAETIARHPAVVALALGGVDLAADLRAELAWEPLLFARSRIVQAAATGSIAAIDVPYLDLRNTDGLGRESKAVKALGFSGKLAIHPGQIGTINTAFAPSAEQLAQAERIVTAFEEAQGGVCVVDGKMVDRPVVLAARRTIQLAGRAG